MIKNGEKTTAYLPLSKESFGVDKINIQVKDDRFIIVAHSESIPEVKTLINILNDETIEGCIVDYSDALGGQLPALTQPRTRTVVTRLTPEEHRQLMYVCSTEGVKAADLLRAGVLAVIRKRLKYRGADKSRLDAIALRKQKMTQTQYKRQNKKWKKKLLWQCYISVKELTATR